MEFKYLRKITISYLKFLAKFRIKPTVVNVFDTLAQARTILVLMPYELDDFAIALKNSDTAQDSFPEAKIVLVVRDSYKNLLNQSSKYGTIFVAPKDVNLLGLPKKNIISELMASNYDIAIDLNHSFHLLSTYLCQKSGASLRICLESREREPFYNFSIRSANEEKLDNKYRNLFKYLKTKVEEPLANN
jgi:ADP-heptose:LPS heptosyltransferase